MREVAYRKTYRDIQPDGSFVFTQPEVPPGFEDWVTKKIELAQKLWSARVAYGVYVERVPSEVPENEDLIERGDLAKEEMSEVASVMLGEFEVVFENDRPRLKVVDTGTLTREIVEHLEENRRRWLEKHRKFSKIFPWVSKLIERALALKEMGAPRQMLDALTFLSLVDLRSKK